MNEISVENLTNEKIDLDLIKNIAEYTLTKENVKKAIANIVIVDNEKIRNINRKYRNIDKETDVISFALEDDDTFIEIPVRVLGDIYISVDKVISQAEEYGHSFKREIAFLVVHGLLHLLGYNHMKVEDEIVMFKKQDDILDDLEITR